MCVCQLILLGLCYVLANAADIEVVSPHDGDFLKSGRTFSIYCKLTNVQSTTHSVYWERLHNGSMTEISADLEIKSPFVETGRYNVSLKYDPIAKTILYYLKISNVQAEDSSSLQCRHNGVTDSTLLTVYVAPQMKINNYQQGEKVQFLASVYKEKGASFTCLITGAYPRPISKVFLGYDDVTNAFRFETRERIITNNQIMGIVYDITGHTDKFRIHPELDQLVFSLRSETVKYRAEMWNITLEVLSSPRLDCGGFSAHKAILGTNNYTVICYIYGHPLPEAIIWTWGGNTLKPGMPSIGGISSSLEKKTTSLEVSLTFASIRLDDFQQKFSLFANNTYGSDIEVMQLHQVKTSNSPVMHGSVLATMMMLLTSRIW